MSTSGFLSHITMHEQGRNGKGSDVGGGSVSVKGRTQRTLKHSHCNGQNLGGEPHLAAERLGKLFFSWVTIAELNALAL